MDNVICIIPARGGSKGLPRKNVLPLNGKPLVVHPIDAAKASGAIGTILVTTDDDEIAAIAKTAGAIVPFMRPANLAEDLTTTEATLQHALVTYEEMTKTKFDICVFLTATDVFRDPAWIKLAVDRLREDASLESVFSGQPTHKNFWQRNDDGSYVRLADWMSVYSSRQIRKPVFREDTGLACASRAALWRAGRRIGDKVDIIPNNDPASVIDIHSEFDIYLAEQVFAWRKTHSH